MLSERIVRIVLLFDPIFDLFDASDTVLFGLYDAFLRRADKLIVNEIRLIV